MASIKISHLPQLTETTLTDDDQFVLNDANQTTSRLGYGDFKTNLLATNLTFSGSVNITGDLTITESVTSNVPTKGQVATDIQTEVDRAVAAEAALGVRIDGVTNGVALLAAPENTFVGNLEVNGVLTQAGSSVLTAATTTDVVRTGSQTTEMTGSLEVNGALTRAGSLVATAADLAGLGQTIQDASDLGQQGIDDAAAAATAASIADGKAVAAQGTAADLGDQIGNVDDDPTDTTINGKLNATGDGLNELKAAAATALAAFEANGATDANKLNACQSFFNTVQAINVTAFGL